MTRALLPAVVSWLALAGCGRTPEAAAEPASTPPSAQVRWVAIRAAKDAAPIELPAKVLSGADSVAFVSPPLPARITSIDVKPGDIVTQGAPLIGVMMPEVDMAASAYAASQVSLKVLAKRREQMRSLEADGLVRASDLVAVDLDIARFTGESLRAQATLRVAGTTRAGPLKLVAPIGGVVVEVAAILGEQRRPEDGPLVRIRSTSASRVEAMFPEAVDANGRFAFRPAGSTAALPVKYVSAAPTLGRAGYTAWFDVAGGLGLVGGTVGQLLVQAAAADAFVVPASAVADRDGQRVILTRDRSGPARVTPVRILQVASTDAIVSAPTPPGALVASEFVPEVSSPDAGAVP